MFKIINLPEAVRSHSSFFENSRLHTSLKFNSQTIRCTIQFYLRLTAKKLFNLALSGSLWKELSLASSLRVPKGVQWGCIRCYSLRWRPKSTCDYRNSPSQAESGEPLNCLKRCTSLHPKCSHVWAKGTLWIFRRWLSIDMCVELLVNP